MDRKYVEFSEDPEGFFYIYLDDTRRNIIVEHYFGVRKEAGGVRRTVSGKVNRIFKGTSAETLYRTILGTVPIGSMDHAAYLGYELGKAETALKNNTRYEQDKSVRL